MPAASVLRASVFGDTTDCRHQMRAAELLFTFRRAYGQLNAHAVQRLNLLRHSTGQHRDPILAKNLSYFVGHIFILVHQQAWMMLNESHLAAKTPKHLPELQPDVAATDD